MNLAGGSGDDNDGWLWGLSAIALYALISFGLDYRARARRGSRHPARDALHDLRDREEPQSPRHRVVSRLIMLGGALLTGLVAYLTGGFLRVAATGLTAVVAVTVWAFYDHWTETRDAAGR